MDLFHYCSIETFENILASKKLWLTPVVSMNDGTEVNHLYNVIYPKVRKNIISQTHNDNIIQIFKYVDNNFITYTVNMPYCACFSDNGDLLSQWNEYAENGTGVSLGFNSDFFNVQNRYPRPNTTLSLAVGLESVIYDLNSQENELHELINGVLSLDDLSATTWITILKILTVNSSKYKNEQFSSEQEKRIVYYYIEQHDSQFNGSLLSGPHRYSCDGNDYQRFDISWYNSPTEHAISTVYLGPKCQRTPVEILKMMEKYEIIISENQIIKSE